MVFHISYKIKKVHFFGFFVAKYNIIKDKSLFFEEGGTIYEGVIYMTWQEEFKNNVTTVSELARYLPLSEEEQQRIAAVIAVYPMSISRYYLSLINPNDPEDPIRKMAVPSGWEMITTKGSFDTSGEQENTKMAGLQHKYPQTSLLLSTNICAMYCRHCFRKRLVGLSDNEIMTQFDQMASYIRNHPELSNILVSGGDSFLNSNHVLDYYLKTLTAIDHLDFIRFGTRLPVVFPQRIYNDESLLTLLKKYNKKKRIHVVTQFNHPNEITIETQRALDALMDCGIVVNNQTVLLKGVNDTPNTMATLMRRLTAVGVIPYYVFQCRPVTSVQTQFQVPLLRGVQIIDETKAMLNGMAKRFRYTMSHVTGKIEILGQFADHMLFKYHQAKDQKDQARMFAQHVGAEQCWLEDIPQV